jgi:hypothetical protein
MSRHLLRNSLRPIEPIKDIARTLKRFGLELGGKTQPHLASEFAIAAVFGTVRPLHSSRYGDGGLSESSVRLWSAKPERFRQRTDLRGARPGPISEVAITLIEVGLLGCSGLDLLTVSSSHVAE